jgi:hypothetical protein
MSFQDPSHVVAALRDFDILPEDALIGSRVVRLLLGGVSDDTIERRIKAGKLPSPIKVDEKNKFSRSFWRVGAIRQVLKDAV